MAMIDPIKWKVPKVPFILGGVMLIAFAYYFVLYAPHTVSHWEIAATCVASVAFGAALGVFPYVLDYWAIGKVIEVNALGAVADKIEHLDQFCAQISAATGRWAAVQEFVGENAEKTATAARQIADKMSAEVREFSEFMKKMSDSEKTTLRVEVEKLRRAEAEWVQTQVRILDHIFALHVAAVRSNQPKFAEQIAQFQNACRGTVRRIGLVSIVGEPNEPFNPERHQLPDTKQKPADGSVISETIASGYTFQGRLLRPALVRIREAALPTPPIASPPEKTIVLDTAQDSLALDAG
jgi:molecular chaperone GrpE (heat shock protein)